jgi:hypothetical protein
MIGIGIEVGIEVRIMVVGFTSVDPLAETTLRVTLA